MANLSKVRRDHMIQFLELLKKEHSDDESLIAINQIEKELTSRRYGLLWEEHEEHADTLLKTHIPVFKEIAEREIKGAAEEKCHFLIEGDNLHSLYLLKKTHKGKIQVIYIDPPYNTKNRDFIYDDNMVGEDDSFKHSKWLSFMEKRLKLARDLLAPEGVIFISINDYEGAQLKMLCDRIFSESNFVGQITWESTTQPTNAGMARFSLQKKVESIYCYAKNKARRSGFVLKELESDQKYPHKGRFGKCRFEIIEKSDAGAYKRDSMRFAILGQYPREGKRWQIGEERARDLEREGKLEIVDGIVKRAIYPEDEAEKRKFIPFWSHLTAETVGTAQNGKDELNEILGYAAGFDTVKPVNLIKELLSHFPDSVCVLDFFAGSGTTAQAVLELNEEDGGNRQFIVCTNNDNAICEKITYQRIRTVLTGLREDGSRYSDGISANMKYYRTDFVSRQEEYPADALMQYVMELIQLKEGWKNSSYTVILSDEEVDQMEQHWEERPYIQKAYISRDVLLTAQQETLLERTVTDIIPDCFYDTELREAGEIW